MKTMFGIVALALMLSGCSTPQSVSRMEGKGNAQIFDAGYDRVWSAATAAAQEDDLYILNSDKSHGFISAKRSLRPDTFGENVGIWVQRVSPTQTRVEVVSRQAGPPVLILHNWEKRILTFIEANLTT